MPPAGPSGCTDHLAVASEPDPAVPPPWLRLKAVMPVRRALAPASSLRPARAPMRPPAPGPVAAAVVFALGLAAAPASAAPTGVTLLGQVTVAENGDPLAGVEVELHT